jgi:DNA-binding SARP family transcriptional activator
MVNLEERLPVTEVGAASPSSLRVNLFGPFEAQVNGRPLPHLRTRKGQWLLALLALRGGAEVERERLAGLLWPESPGSHGLANLRNSLRDLRQALGPEAERLRAPTPRTLSLDVTGAAVDVVEFDRAIARGDLPSLERAVALYRGPLLQGCGEEWAFQERQLREQSYLQALETLADHALAAGDLAGAERSLRHVVAVEPLRESAHRGRIRILAAGGNYAAALLAYRELREQLHDQVNAEPDPETRALFEQLRAQARSRAATPTPTPASSARIALLYKRNAQPDERLLHLLEAGLTRQGYQLFIDRHLAVGEEWARAIEREVRSAEAVIPLLSAASVESEMLAYEVQIAHEASRRQGGKPRLLPVRVKYTASLREPLSAILGPLHYSLWESPADDERVVAELVQALTTPPSARETVPPWKLEPVGGAVPLDSRFYVERVTDGEFQAAMARGEGLILVKGARQMGKTSLLSRGLHQARQNGARVLWTDLQMLDAGDLESVDRFFRALAEMMADRLDLDVLPDQVWRPQLGASANFGRYLRRAVLAERAEPLVWGLDEVDRLFDRDFGSQVFGLFRAWYNERQVEPSSPWSRLILAIAYATEAHLFITDPNQSPFNVGARLMLHDLTLPQVEDLNERHGSPLHGSDEVERFYGLVSGQPFLVRRGLLEMASHGLDISALEAQADRDEGIFGDHLRRILVLLVKDPELRDAVRGVLRGEPCPTPESFYRLRSAGVLTGGSAREARPRCRLYDRYLSRHLL